ncbi:MAG: PhoH family protein, partial [Burkholderiales bacterium]|nr:PhoH family protein [Burkholderiales bacterium]
MPLPKPPQKKASLLGAADFEAQAAPRHEKRALKPAAAAELAEGGSLELLDTRSAPAAAVLAP